MVLSVSRNETLFIYNIICIVRWFIYESDSSIIWNQTSVNEWSFLGTRSATVGGLVSTTIPLVASVKRLGQASALVGVFGDKIYGESDDQRNEECGQPHRNNRVSDNDWTIVFVGVVRRGWRLCENAVLWAYPKDFLLGIGRECCS